MDLPLGAPFYEHLRTKDTDMLKMIQELMQKEFTGYIIVTIDGYDGIEEGALFLGKVFLLAQATNS